MTAESRQTGIADDALFAIACPACLGHLSVAKTLAGDAACCPRCTAAFLVPEPRLAEAVERTPLPVAEPEPEPLPPVGDDNAAPAIPGLALHEPVTTLGRGAGAIELKRLSDEERRIRRGRRNVVLLLVGAALLAALVVLLGSPNAAA